MGKEINTDQKKIDELLARGVVEVIVADDLRAKLQSGEQLRVKLGIDPTSPNLHIGRSIPLLKLRDFQALGHQIVLIIGNFTGTIGDTSDKEAERPMLDPAVVEQNMKSYAEQAGKIIDMSKVELTYNADWLGKLTYSEIGFQADQFSVSDFIARDNIRRRLDGGKRVSLREMLYPLMQGYDSVAIKADVEIGGTDQRFNILAGRTLQTAYKQKPQNIILNPLIAGLDGRKMSSSWGNTINLTAEPNDMYGKVMSLHDDLIIDYFTLVTRVPLGEVEEHGRALAGGINPRDLKMKLAREIVRLYQGAEAAEQAENNFVTTFQKKEIPAEIPEIEMMAGESLVDLLLRAGLVESKSDFRRLIEGGAINLMMGEKISDPSAIATVGVYKIGKKKFIKIK